MNIPLNFQVPQPRFAKSKSEPQLEHIGMDGDWIGPNLDHRFVGDPPDVVVTRPDGSTNSLYTRPSNSDRLDIAPLWPIHKEKKR